MRRALKRLTPAHRKTLGNLLFAALLFALATGFSLQNSLAFAQSSKQAKGTIRGRVVDENGQPFANAIVTLYSFQGVENDNREVITDDDGSFQANDLPDTAYRVHCKASGYIADDQDSNRYHYIGGSVTLRLIKGGVITGTITNSMGEPIVKAKVNFMLVRDSKGHSLHSHSFGSDTETDDRGIYRFYGLHTGAYLVFVNRTGEFNDEAFRNEAAIYFPSATRDNAKEVKVSVGQEVSGIDIRYRGERGHIISGKLAGALGKNAATVRLKLLNASHKSLEADDVQADEGTHSFTFYGVPDGDYYLLAQNDYEEPYSVSLPRRVSVKGKDVTGIELNLFPLGSIAGRVVFDHSPTAKCKEVRPTVREEVLLTALRDQPKNLKEDIAWLFDDEAVALANEKGEFIIDSLFSGQYLLTAKPLDEDFYVRSVSVPVPKRTEGKHSALTVKQGEQVKNVTVKLARGAAGIRGQIKVADEKTKLPEHLYICLIPSESEKADDILRFAEAEIESDGAFSLTNLAPGRYLIFYRASSDKNQVAANPLAALNTEQRAKLRREAEATNLVIELQTCQRLSDYQLAYPLLAPITKVESLKDSQPVGSLKPQAPIGNAQAQSKTSKTKKKRRINQ